jgi:hypothetical protein
VEACDQQQDSVLTRLPPELRLRIYELCSEGFARWDVHIHPNYYYYARGHFRLHAEHECHTALLRTCRKVYVFPLLLDCRCLEETTTASLPVSLACEHAVRYREAIPTFYCSNTFTFYSSQYLFAFTQTVLPQRLAVIRRVTLATTLHSTESHFYSTRFLHEIHELSDVWLLLGSMAQLKTVVLRYTIADIEYWRHPVRCHFAMLEDATNMTEEAVFDVFYEIETRFEIEEGLKRSDGGQEQDLLFGQWRVDEWTWVERKVG